MKKSVLVSLLAEKTGLTCLETKKTLDAFMEFVGEQLREKEDVALIGFGTFKSRYRPEKQGRNPSTGETITIAAKNVAYFKAGKGLTDKLNV